MPGSRVPRAARLAGSTPTASTQASSKDAERPKLQGRSLANRRVRPAPRTLHTCQQNNLHSKIPSPREKHAKCHESSLKLIQEEGFG
ncbi:hypothetical protein B0H17DRAFT_1097357 [Mycena rosella]|uniref:Uncharacterized protein n=1 Tax=Mycena rosella TaxID=1033263 RepID=A0AAD7CQ97_MYCRO|nr:hypothetical protein B0H17DRAFT_1097357 [Mycena rosella]